MMVETTKAANEANCTNFKFFFCVCSFLEMETPVYLLLKESQFLPPITSHYRILIYHVHKIVKMGVCCLTSVINYENMFSFSVGIDLLMGNMSES